MEFRAESASTAGGMGNTRLVLAARLAVLRHEQHSGTSSGRKCDLESNRGVRESVLPIDECFLMHT